MRNNLKECRVKKGYTQKQFAETLKITTTQYQRIELGKSDGSIKLWVKIKELLAQPIDNLIENTP
jgi:DNA-binding XRE family transcriptional regulator